MKTLALCPGTHWSMLFEGISANRSVPLRVQTGPSVHLLKPVATFSSVAFGRHKLVESGIELLNLLRESCGGCEQHGNESESVADRHMRGILPQNSTQLSKLSSSEVESLP